MLCYPAFRAGSSRINLYPTLPFPIVYIRFCPVHGLLDAFENPYTLTTVPDTSGFVQLDSF